MFYTDDHKYFGIVYGKLEKTSARFMVLIVGFDRILYDKKLINQVPFVSKTDEAVSG